MAEAKSAKRLLWGLVVVVALLNVVLFLVCSRSASPAPSDDPGRTNAVSAGGGAPQPGAADRR